MSDFTGVIEELRPPTRALRRSIPGAWAAFSQLHDATMKDGALPARVKELIALVVAVVKRCDGCIAYHAHAAAQEGATPEEVADALGVALLMDGGPASVYGPRAWETYSEFMRRRAAAPPETSDGSGAGPASNRHRPTSWRGGRAPLPARASGF
jgi:AhpD family alkylhydroperoxidase